MAFLLHETCRQADITSIDISPVIIKILEPYQDERLHFICRDVFAYNDSCDMVVADQAIIGKIEPFKKILEKLQSLARTVLIAEIKPNVLINIIRCKNDIDDNIENEIDTGYKQFEQQFIATFAKTRIIEQTYYKVWIGERERS